MLFYGGNIMYAYIKGDLEEKSNGFVVVDLTTGKVYNTSRKIDIEKIKQAFNQWNIDKFGIPITKR